MAYSWRAPKTEVSLDTNKQISLLKLKTTKYLHFNLGPYYIVIVILFFLIIYLMLYIYIYIIISYGVLI